MEENNGEEPNTDKEVEKSETPVTGTAINLPVDQRPIDRGFWYKMSREWVVSTEERLAKQATAIQDTVKWFFTLGIVGTIFGLFFKEKSVAKLDLTEIGIALFCLFVAFATATLSATMPSKSIEDPNDSQSIKNSFNNAVITARILLIIASLLLILGMGLIIPALYKAYNNQPASQDIVKIAGSYNIEKVNQKQGPSGEVEHKIFISDIHITASIKDSNSMIIRLYCGPSFGKAIQLDLFKHSSVNRNFELIYTPKKKLNKLETDNLYLGISYSTKTDSLETKTTLLKLD